ncbi:hypothetical protein B4102_0231 [Heyndrickxia sporothermodurans]|uniref:Phage tail sheath protein n=1 Tax=Heyndrickxia sporothermodurans TaxID=46224 RepID=A0A150KSE3_9BACI|nr:phage tail sheath family protein [Heyndrickxia sporothermodurans]KYD02637.1 hypothetical protein B4102_0231 [Heyndrickxia sporothermodurans]
MTYKHGVNILEAPTSVIAPVTATAGLKVVVGTAPINLAKTTEYVNKPLLAFSWAEAVEGLGYSDEWNDYTLCEEMDCTFRLYGVGPVVFINVLDPSKHISDGNADAEIIGKKAIIREKGILLESLKVKLSADGQTLTKDADYLSSFDEEGNVVIAILSSGSVPQGQTSLSVSFSKIDPSKVTKNDIIGGVDVNTGDSTGLELINSVFPKFGLVPGQILAPKFSKDSTVAAVMRAKATSINLYFKAISLDDADTKVANTYTKVSEWKNSNNYVSPYENVCWPMGGLGDKIYHLSTHVASVIALTDSQYDDVPYVSPSNRFLQLDKVVLEDGKEVTLGPDQANYLNGQGIVTALNFIGRLKVWGNRTAAYPANTDVKDSFIPVRRMHNWVSNTIVLTTWQKVDDPTNKTLIDSVVDTLNSWLNGLTSDGALVGGRVEFREEDNPTTDLIDGTVRFRVLLAEPTPGENLEFIVEFDATYYQTLFE